MSFDQHGGTDADEGDSSEKIVSKLRQVDVMVAQGQPVATAVKKMRVTEQSYHRWATSTAA